MKEIAERHGKMLAYLKKGFGARLIAYEYPWSIHWLMLAPLVFFICVTGCLHGFWGEQPRLWYTALRESFPGLTSYIRAVTNYVEPAIYISYAYLLLSALIRHDERRFLFVLRFVCGALLFTLVVTPALKTGLGMPRPGYPLPPQPFSCLNAYSSFPSGHTVAVITAAIPLAFRIGSRKTYFAAALLMAAVGFSRLWLGLHHPVDILGAVAVGTMAARCIYFEQK